MKKSRKSLVKTEPSTEEVAVETSHVVDHLDQIAAKFSNLYWSEDFSDVELVINGAHRFKVHRAALAMSSDVFRQMFSEGRWQESGLPEVPLTEEESCVDHMNSFLQYFYTGVLSVDAGNLFPLLVLTDKYNVAAARRSCEQFALRSVCAGPVSRALSWWRSAERVAFRELEEACRSFVSLNAAALAASSSDWLSLEPGRLRLLLESDELRVENEFQLFCAVKRWLSHNEVSGSPETEATKILEHVRFPLMSPLDVYHTSFADTQPASVRDYFLSESALMYQVNSLPMEAIGLHHDIQAPRFTMRLYTSSDFGCSRTIENVSAPQSFVIDFKTNVFQSQTSWKITAQFHQNRHTNDPLLNQLWTCKITDCNLTDENHEHQLSVLMYTNVADTWLACSYETFSIPHKQDVPLGALMEKFQKNKCIHKNMIFAHFIGKTRWGKFAKNWS